MGSSESAPASLATLFPAGAERSRGPILGCSLTRGPEGVGWRLLTVAPLGVYIYDARTASAITLENPRVSSVLRDRTPVTASAFSVDEASELRRLALGCQDGALVVLSVAGGLVVEPICELRPASTVEQRSSDTGDIKEVSEPIASITVVCFGSSGRLYAGLRGYCWCWTLGDDGSSTLVCELTLPGSSEDVAPTPSAFMVSGGCADNDLENSGDGDGGERLWVGLSSGIIIVFDAVSGILMRQIETGGPEVVLSVVHASECGLMFALSAHTRVGVWDMASYEKQQTYQAKLIMCGTDLSSMVAVRHKTFDATLLLLGGIDGSFCARRVHRRSDGKVNCVLIYYVENIAIDMACPVTSLNYHLHTDTVLAGDASCTVALIESVQKSLAPGANAAMEANARAAAAASFSAQAGAAAGLSPGVIASASAAVATATAVTRRNSKPGPPTAHVGADVPCVSKKSTGSDGEGSVTATTSPVVVDRGQDSSRGGSRGSNLRGDVSSEGDSANFPVFQGI